VRIFYPDDAEILSTLYPGNLPSDHPSLTSDACKQLIIKALLKFIEIGIKCDYCLCINNEWNFNGAL
jgi:hypothetical protein